MLTNKLKNILNFSGCLTVNSIGSSGGLCLLWKAEVDLYIHSYSPNHIDACEME